jgi:hypothetical protein
MRSEFGHDARAGDGELSFMPIRLLVAVAVAAPRLEHTSDRRLVWLCRQTEGSALHPVVSASERKLKLLRRERPFVAGNYGRVVAKPNFDRCVIEHRAGGLRVLLGGRH